MSDRESVDEQLRAPSRGCIFLYFVIDNEGAICVNVSGTHNYICHRSLVVFAATTRSQLSGFVRLRSQPQARER